MIFNEKLFELRKQKGYSQEELADKLNVARQTISKWESGTTTPDFDNLIKLSKIFDISIDEFVGNDYKKELEEKNKKDNNPKIEERKKKLKILLRLLALILIIVFIILAVKVVKRYIVIDKISKNLIYTYNSEETTEFNYTTSIIEFERMENKSCTCIDTYCKDNILKAEHRVADINPNLESNDIITTRIEYIDGDNYYDIDMINKTYTKEVFDRDESYYFYQRTGKELDYAIFDEYDFELYGVLGFLNKLSISLDFSKKIDKSHVEGQNFSSENYRINEGYLYTPEKDCVNLTMHFFEEKKDIAISLDKTEYLDDSKVNTIVKGYSWYKGEVSDEKIAMPDLTEFTLLEK